MSKIYTDSPCLIKINKINNIALHTDVLYIYMNFNNKSELCIVSHVIMVNNRLKKQHITKVYNYNEQSESLSPIPFNYVLLAGIPGVAG